MQMMTTETPDIRTATIDLWTSPHTDMTGIRASIGAQRPEKDDVPNLPTETERVLIQLAVAGNRCALQRLLAPYERRLYRTAYAILRSVEDAEDAVQDAQLKAYLHLQGFRSASSFSTWLHSIVINCALMILRRRRREVSCESLDKKLVTRAHESTTDARLNPEEACAAQQMEELIQQHVAALPEPMRAAFELGGMAGLSGKESSEALGISLATYKTRLYWARRHLVSAIRQSLKRS